MSDPSKGSKYWRMVDSNDHCNTYEHETPAGTIVMCFYYCVVATNQYGTKEGWRQTMVFVPNGQPHTEGPYR